MVRIIGRAMRGNDVICGERVEERTGASETEMQHARACCSKSKGVWQNVIVMEKLRKDGNDGRAGKDEDGADFLQLDVVSCDTCYTWKRQRSKIMKCLTKKCGRILLS